MNYNCEATREHIYLMQCGKTEEVGLLRDKNWETKGDIREIRKKKRQYIPNDNWDNGSSFMSSYRIPDLELHKIYQYIGWNCVYLLGIIREITNLLLISFFLILFYF